MLISYVLLIMRGCISLSTRSISRHFLFPARETVLQPDGRFAGKIKWYLKPIAFGGNASVGENLVWVSHDEHAQLVKWWNDKYRSMNARPK
jgi:hypothetical protein